MNHTLIALISTIVLAMACPAHMAGKDDTTTRDALKRLDDAIAHEAQYIARKDEKVETIKRLWAAAASDDERYACLSMIVDEYQAYDNDSALCYLGRLLETARRMHHPVRENAALVRLGHQHAVTGYYDDAHSYLGQVRSAQLSGDELASYYSAMRHLYGEQAFYTKDEALRRQYSALQQTYDDSLTHTIRRDTPDYCRTMMQRMMDQGQYAQALRYGEQWRSIIGDDSQDFPLLAYLQAVAYGKMGQRDKEKQWYALSATKDIENARMNQASLWSLASVLSEEGETELSHRYIEYSWRCITRFSTHMRGWQVMPIMQSIDADYKSVMARRRAYIITGFVLVTLLSILMLVFIALLRSKNRTIVESHRSLDEMNRRLIRRGEELARANAQLEDANRVKERYIGDFIHLCTDYIEKLDAFRIKVNRKLKVGQVDELLRQTSSDKLKKQELDELHRHFDKTFLALFPTFIDDFNALLRPDQQMSVSGEDVLSTDLRIFALIRLGIDDSAHIAQFLHYSPNSIYCYRARVKNRARGNRDDFEARVRSIGQFAPDAHNAEEGDVIEN